MTDIIKIPTANLRFSTAASSNRVCLSDFNNDRQPEITAETGNTYISEMTDSVEIPTSNPAFSKMTNSIQESCAVARKPRDAAAVLFDLKFANNIHYKFKSSQASKARLQSSKHIPVQNRKL